MFEYLSQIYQSVRDKYAHGMTTALGIGWTTQATDLAGRLLGLMAIAVGIFCSLDKLRRDRQLHSLRMRLEAERSPTDTGPPGLRVFSP